MAIQKISNTVIDTGAVTSDSLATGAVNAADISAGTITVDKLHTTLNLSSHTVTLPTLNSSVNIDVGDLIVKDTTGGALGQVQIGAGTVQGFINIQKGDGTRTVQISSNGDSYFNGGNVGIGTSSPYTLLELSSTDPILRFNDSNGGTDTKNFEIRYVGTSSPDLDGLYFRTVNDANSVYSDKMVVLGNGNVGIGTDNPGQLLEVTGSGATIRVESTDNNQQGIEFYQNNTKNASIMWGQGSANLEIKNFRNDQHANNLYANIDFFTGGSNATSSGSPAYTPDLVMRLTDDGNVGIGTTNPTVKLTTAIAHSNGAVAEGLKLTTDGSYSSSNSEEAGPAISFGQFHTQYPTWKTGQISGIRDGSNWNGSLSFWTNIGNSETDISEKMRITGAGNVGIGTNGPESKLDVSRGTDTTGYSTTGDQRGEATITVRNASETVGTFAGINFYAGAGTGSDWSINNVRTGSYVGDLTFKTRAGGGSTDWRERMRITASGNVGIGTSTNLSEPVVIYQDESDTYSATGYNDKQTLTLKSPNAQNNYTSIRFSNSVGNYEQMFGTVQTGSDSAEFVWQGHDRAASAYKEWMRLTDDGKVGIGDANPDAKLHVSGNVKVGSAASSSWATSNHDLGGLDVFVGSGSHALQLWDDNYHTRPRFEVQRDGHVYAGQNMQFHEDNTSTTTPFEITGSSSSNNFFVPNTYSSGSVNQTYRHCYTTNAAHHWVLFRGGGGNTVFNTYAFISGEHYQDISVWSVTMYYSDLKIKIIQNTGTDKSIWVAGNTYNNNVYGLNWRIMPVEPCTIQHNPSSSQSTGYMIHHATGGEQFTGTAAFSSGTGPTTY